MAGTQRAFGSALGKVAILIAIAGFFLVGMAGTVYLSLRSPEVEVPEVTGKNILDAEKILADAGLNVRRRASRYSAEVAADTVLDQTPRPGDHVKAGQTIAVVISRAEAKEGESSVGIRRDDETKTDNRNSPGNQNESAASADNRNDNANDNANDNRPKRNTNKNKNANANNRNTNGNTSANGNINSNLNTNLTTNSRNADNRNASGRPDAERNTNARPDSNNLNSGNRNAAASPNANAATNRNANANTNRSRTTNNRNTNTTGNRNARPAAVQTPRP
ncbi:MAG TPA: PASTA domain-containing protein [Pyrinomonadaceae bacterium]|nr:PASTA domain-containing protein [Pyrinomonadaceae bacterium]